MQAIKLTKRSIEAISFTNKGQKLYRVSDLSGLGLRVGKQSKVFFVEGQVDRRTVRVTIGKYGPLTPDIARRRAMKLLAEMADGHNPNTERRTKRASTMTVSR